MPRPLELVDSPAFNISLELTQFNGCKIDPIKELLSESFIGETWVRL